MNTSMSKLSSLTFRAFYGLLITNKFVSFASCLVISGLASHPFGSWQTHGHDKSFMWIRDELPQRLPGVRFLTYGYDTMLSDSTSFQLIPDLAISLVRTLKAIGLPAPSAKPVLFLAHSLGGVVLKQALAILAGGRSEERSILCEDKGGHLFWCFKPRHEYSRNF